MEEVGLEGTDYIYLHEAAMALAIKILFFWM
jgi:hypothetical protein